MRGDEVFGLRDVLGPFQNHFPPAFGNAPLANRTPLETAPVRIFLDGAAALARSVNAFFTAARKVRELVCFKKAVQLVPN